MPRLNKQNMVARDGAHDLSLIRFYQKYFQNNYGHALKKIMRCVEKGSQEMG